MGAILILGGIQLAKTLSRMKSVEIIVIEDGQEKIEKIHILKATLGKWKRLTSSIKKIFELLPEIIKRKGFEDPQVFMEQMTVQDLFLLIPDIMEVATDEFINILALGTDLEKEYIEEKIGLDETIDILEAIIEVNNLIKVVDKGKNLISLWGGMKSYQRKK